MRIAYAGLRTYWFLAPAPSVVGVKCVLTDGDDVLLVRHTYGTPRLGPARAARSGAARLRATPPGGR